MEAFAKWNSQRDVWEQAETPIFGPSDVFSETWPTSGTMRNGVASPLPTWAQRMDGSASFSSPLYPTPAASDWKRDDYPADRLRKSPNLPTISRYFKTPTSQLAVNGGSQHPDKRKAGGHGPTLADEVEHLLPTPTVGMMMGGSMTRSGARNGEKLLPGVAKELALLPTPQAHDATKGKTAEQVAKMRAKGHGVWNLNEVAENELIKLGANTNQQSADGSESTAQLPGQQSLLDEITPTA